MRIPHARHPLDLALTVAGVLLRYGLVVLAASLVALWVVPGARAQSAGGAVLNNAAYSGEPQRASREYLIKAAILYNLAKFATWPETAFGDAEAPLRLCVVGQDPFGPALDSIEGKPVGARVLVTTALADLKHAAACHLLFISASEAYRVTDILAAVAGQPVLTVADIGAFARSGGIVGLTEADDRSRLEINIAAADRAGVQLSSKALRLADTVDTQAAQANTPKKK